MYSQKESGSDTYNKIVMYAEMSTLCNRLLQMYKKSCGGDAGIINISNTLKLQPLGRFHGGTYNI